MDDIQRVGPLFLWRFYPFPVTPLPPRLSSSKQITRQARNQSWFLYFIDFEAFALAIQTMDAAVKEERIFSTAW